MNSETRQKLFDYFESQHDLTLWDSDFLDLENILSVDLKTDQYIEDLRAQVDNAHGTLDHMREFLLYYSKEKLPDYDDHWKLKTIQQLCDQWHIRLTNK